MESRRVAFESGFFHSVGVESACLHGCFQPEAPWFMSGLEDAEGFQGLGGGVGRVSSAFHFCCALKLASQLAGPLSPGDPHVCLACTVLGIY